MKFLNSMLKRFNSMPLLCGTDEAGRGCLAGPVTAAAVILPKTFNVKLLNDSKKLSVSKREEFRDIIEKQALYYAVFNVKETIIDDINILNASIKAMHGAIDLLKKIPEYIIVDGNRFKPYNNIPFETIVKGDGKYLSIAAASVLAKTARDAYMLELHNEFPMYNWKQNKGYPTKEHRVAIQQYGPCKYHRKTFKLLPSQLALKL